MKRRPIRTKVQNMVLMISIVALLITSAVGIVSMMRIQKDSESALTSQMEQNLDTITRNKATLADSELGKFSGYVQNFADYIHGLYTNPAGYVNHEVLPPKEENAGVFVIQRTLRDKAVNVSEVMEEMNLLGNLEQIWAPVLLSNKGVITVIYIGTESGFLLGYDNQSELSAEGGKDIYYDYSKSEWYNLAKKTGKTSFTNIYMDGYNRGMMITCTTPFYDASGKFAGAVGMDILISDLYREIVALELGKDAYAFLIDGKGNIISPTDLDKGEARSIHQDEDITPLVASRILAGETGISLTENRVYYAYAPVKSTGWKFCVRIPENVILAPVRDVNRNVIITMILFVAAFVVILVIVAVVARSFSDRLTRPILALGRDVQKISNGNLDYRAQIHDNDEIGDLAENFNEMAASLKEYMHDFGVVVAEKERISSELNIATQIQADMLPKILPPYLGHEKFEIYASMNPAKEVGGDFYDFFLIDDDHLGLVMADVSGKGVPAALFMVIAKTLIKNRAQMGGTPGEILADVNDQLCEGNEADLFVTVWLGILELSTGHVIASNAGHEYPAIRRTSGKYELFKTKQSPAVATMDGIRFRESEFTLEHGDSLYIYTDGVPEATNINDELYGTDRMLDKLNATIGSGAEEVLSAVRKDVFDFTGDAPQFDDVTMLYLKFTGGTAQEMHELIVDAKTDKLDEVLDFIDAHLEEWDCPMKTITQINIAAEEVFVNIAHYAYNPKDGKAKITLSRTGQDVEITFSDEGTPYNPLEHEDPDVTLSAEERDIGGLGIYIVKKSMDAVSYEYRDSHNVLKIRKNIE